jgi:sugar lactone lactonase YvrE
MDALETCLGERAFERIDTVLLVRGASSQVAVKVGTRFAFPALASVLSLWKAGTVSGQEVLGMNPMIGEPICEETQFNCLARWRNPFKDSAEVFAPGWSGPVSSEDGIPVAGRPLLVTMLHGLSYGVDASGAPEADPLAPASRLIDSALAAEASGGASGKFMFMRNSADPSRSILDHEYDGVISELSQRGYVDAQAVDFDAALTGEYFASFFVGAANLGNYDPEGGSSTIEGNTYAPGSLVDNITSVGATPTNFDPNCVCPPVGLCACYFEPNQPSIARWVAMAVGGVHGTVGEPWSNAFPSRRLILDYVDGATLAEAYFRNMPFVFWKNLILGDPMAAPYATRPIVTIGGVTEGQPVSGTVQVTVNATDPGARGISSVRLLVDGVEVASASGGNLTACVGADSDGTQLLAVAQAAAAGPLGPGNFRPKGWTEVRVDTGTGPAAAPCPPILWRASPGDGEATVAWEKPASGGSPITGYTVTSSPGGFTAPAGPADTSAVVTGLQNGTAYTFTVTATNAAGTSSPSAPSAAVTPAQVPGAPAIGSATAGFERATVTWSAPASDGGSPLVSYTLTSNPGAVTAEADPDATAATIFGLVNGTSYTFTVTAQNAVGTGASSGTSNAVTPATVPDPPVMGAASLTLGGITVTWSPPPSDGGSPVTGYRVEANRTIDTVAGDGEPTTIALPYGIAMDAAGILYLADPGADLIRKVNGAIITTVAGGGTGGLGDGGPATSAELFSPGGVALHGSDTLYIADTGHHRVRKVDLTSGIITTVAGDGTAGFGGDGGAAALAQLRAPADVAVDAAGYLYIADTDNHRVRRVTPLMGIMATVAGTGSPGFNGDGQPATSAQLWGPEGVALDAVGNLHIADTVNGRVRKVSGDGSISTVAGGGVNPYGNGGAATAAQLVTPYGIALDGDGNLYISEGFKSIVRQVNPGGTISTVAGNGGHGFGGDGGSATAAQLRYPRGLAVDGTGKLFIADAFNSRVRAVIPGDRFTLAGAGAASAEVTGLAADTSYTFAVGAINAIGMSAPSASSNAVLTPSVPGAPTDVTAVLTGADTALVSWTAPLSDGGSPITGYIVTSDPDGIVVVVGAGETTATVSGLSAGKSYTFTVVATNAFGSSAASQSSNTIATPPDIPALGKAAFVLFILLIALGARLARRRRTA